MSWPTGFWATTASELGGLAVLVAVATLWLAATRGLRSGDRFDRLLDGFLILAWLAVVSFWALAAVGMFRLVPLAVALTVPAALLAWRRGRRAAAQPVTAGSTPSPYGRVLWVVAAPWIVIAAARLLKGLVSPPMAWDSLTYHLPKAAMWVQSGGLDLVQFPDAWSYYRWFPVGSDILWAWLMLATRSEFLVAPVGAFLWGLVVVAARRLAVLGGARPPVAWMAGLTLVTLPCVAAFATSGYADIPELLFVLLSLSHALVFYRHGRQASALLAAAAIGLAVATKTTGLAVAPVIGVLLLLGLRRHGMAGRRLVAATVALALLPALGYVRAWWVTGSPLYPMRVPVLYSLPYHQGFDELHTGEILPAEVTDVPRLEKVVALFWSHGGGHGHLNFGIGGLALTLLAAAGALRGISGAHRDLLLAAGATAVLTVPLLFGDLAALHTLWLEVMGRLLVAGVGPLVAVAALLPGRVALTGLSVAAVLNLFHARPLGYSPAVTTAALLAAAILLAIGLIAWAAVRRRAWHRSWRLVALALVAAAAYPPLAVLRDVARYPIWSEAGQAGSAFDAHGLTPAFSRLAPVAAAVDDGRPKRLAVTAGASGTGHNQFLFPLLGRRLGNELVYVPMTETGNDDELGIGERRAAASELLWLERLAAARVDFVVALWPEPTEWQWVEAHPDRFEIVSVGTPGFYRLARVR